MYAPFGAGVLVGPGRIFTSGDPLLAGANHYAISATVTADPDRPLGAFIGGMHH